MPRVLPGPAAQLNATQEKGENEKNRENAEPNFTSTRGNYCTAQKRLRDHPPKMKRRNPIRQFPTVCVRNCASSNRSSPQRQPCKRGGLRVLNRGFDYRVTVWTTLLVPFTALCAMFLAVIAVPLATFLAVRTGPA